MWSDQDLEDAKIEHLGIAASPANPNWHVLPRGGWTKLQNGIAVLASVPGSTQVRLKLALADLRPPWLWTSPLAVPNPRR
eukprot:8931300-Pyramimonas_sp.AAC.1